MTASAYSNDPLTVQALGNALGLRLVWEECA